MLSTVCAASCDAAKFRRVLTLDTALQIGDKYRVTTPVTWRKGDDVIVHPSVKTEEAKEKETEHDEL